MQSCPWPWIGRTCSVMAGLCLLGLCTALCAGKVDLGRLLNRHAELLQFRPCRALDNELNSFARVFDFPGLELEGDRRAALASSVSRRHVD